MQDDYNPNIHPQMPEVPQVPQPPVFPPMPMRRKKPHSMFPRWLSQRAVVTYLLAMAVVTMMYSAYSLPWYYMLSGCVSVLVFFLLGRKLAQQTVIEKVRKEKNFEKRIFWIAFIPRLLWMVLIYTIFMNTYGDAFGFDNADAVTYDTLAREISYGLRHGRVNYNTIFKGMDISDKGYATYLGFVYYLSNDNVLISRILKCIWSSLTVLLLYRLAKRNFGPQIARIAALFCALWPNLWYYCGCQLKEVEMVFLVVLFVEQSDQMLRSRLFTTWKIIPILIIAAAMFTFRTPLGLVALLALVFSAVMSSTRVVSWGKRILVGVLAIMLMGVIAGNRIEEKSRALLETVESDQQQQNMQWRTRRENGNAFAKHIGSAVFAPLIFTIPFPSMVRPFEGQDVQQLLNGGNYIKNILSGFTIFALVTLLLSGKWREHLLPLSFLLGYLVVLVFSSFAHSERFHQPVMPFELMFAAYGLSIAPTKRKYKRWFVYWYVLMFVAAIVWSWFKLAGRGLA